MKKPSEKKMILAIIVLATAYALAMLNGDLTNMRISLEKISISVLVFLFSLTMANNFLRFLKWDLFLRNVGVKINFVDSMIIFFSGFSLLLTPGKVGGEAMKIHLLKKEKNIDVSKTTSVVVIDRVADVLGLALLGALGLLLFGTNHGTLPFVAAISIPIITVVLLKNAAFTRFLLSVPLIRTSDFVKNVILHFNAFSIKVFVASTVLAAVAWSFEAFALYYLLQSFGIHATFSATAFVFSSSMLFGNITMIPGGVGAVEAGIAILIKNFFATSLALAATSALIFRIVSFWAINVIGFVALAVFYRRQKK